MNVRPLPQKALACAIRPFRQDDAKAFATLNAAWIEELFVMEASDRRILGDPQSVVLESGGAILVAESAGKVVGCCALLPAGTGTLEVAKMAVERELRGRGVGKLLLAGVLEQARKMGAREVVLKTSRRLTAARHLYDSFGFVEVEESHSPLHRNLRADMFLRLCLTK